MRVIHEEHLALASPCFWKPWREFSSEEIELHLWIGLARDHASLAVFESHFVECPASLRRAEMDSGQLENALNGGGHIRRRMGGKGAAQTGQERFQAA